MDDLVTPAGIDPVSNNPVGWPVYSDYIKSNNCGEYNKKKRVNNPLPFFFINRLH